MVANTQQTIVPTCETVRVKLTVPLVLSYLLKEYSQAKIGQITGRSQQAVSQFVAKHYDVLQPLANKDNLYMAAKSKYIASRAQDVTIDILDSCQDFNKRDLIPVTATLDRNITTHRLLSDESTANVSVSTVNSNMAERQKQREELLKELSDI